jgi:hypothetical protein
MLQIKHLCLAPLSVKESNWFEATLFHVTYTLPRPKEDHFEPTAVRTTKYEFQNSITHAQTLQV